MKEEATGVVGSSVSWVLTATQVNEVFEIIQICFSIAVSLITILYIVYKWYKRATADGKITEEELEELKKEVDEHVKH